MDSNMKNLFKFALKVNKLETEIIDFLIKSNKGFNPIELSKILDKDRTTIQKCVKKLEENNILIKRQMNMNRGFCFLYFIKNKETIKELLSSALDNQYNLFKKAIEEF